MGVGSILCGVLGLLGVSSMLVLGMGTFYAGAALGAIAVVLGALARKTTSGKAGLVLGVLTVLEGAVLVALFTVRKPVEKATPVTVPVPATATPR